MVRGEVVQTKVHYKGKEDDFHVFVDDVDNYEKWRQGDTTIPLAQFVSAFKIYVTHNQGNQGLFNTASKSTLENEFDTSADEEVIKKILEKGTMQASEMSDRQGPKNDSMSAMHAR